QGARDYQQDSFISNFPIGQKYGYAIIADGLGGHVSGEVASALAVSEMFAQLKMHSDKIENAATDLPLILRESVELANARIAAHMNGKASLKGMGTTMLATILSGRQLSWVSIGDSPLLLFRDGALRRLNKDHSMASQIDAMVQVGSMSADKGKDNPERSILTSILNGTDIAKIDCPSTSIQLLPGDILIAASDGLFSLSNAQLANTVSQHALETSATLANALLIGLQEKNDPKQDNATFVIIKVGENVTDPTVIKAEDMPVLAMADDSEETSPEPIKAERIERPKKKKTYFYRGQEYERED
ncbi:unnamed protein product, partial [Ectocarpus sp. 12 AP-2014]